MHIGVYAPFVSSYNTPAFTIQAAQAAERHGFHSIWAPEHVLLFDEYNSKYPYTEDGRLRIGPDGGVLEPLNLLSFMAGATSTIRLGTGICLVPQRNPVYTAKEVATVDYLSGGRVDFGVGIGWLAEEFEALGVPWEHRAQRTRDYIKVMLSLWTDSVSTFSSKFYELPPSKQFPKPVQKPHPPVHFGGESDAALRRVADIGQGWFGYNLSPEETTERLGYLSERLAQRNRTLADVTISIAPNRRLEPGALEAYHAVGVAQLIVPARGRTAEEFLDSLAEMGDGLVKAAAAL
jgi:probable F420-dependent oxidoreductase